MSSEPEKIKVQCIACGRETNHDILHQVIRNDSIPEVLDWWATFQLIQCRGCDTVSFREASGNSEDFDEDGPVVNERLYPGRTSGKTLMKGHEMFPSRTGQMYKEVLQALNNDAPILAAIGLRALIETICIDQGTKSKNLIGGIDELASMGLLAERQAKLLHAHRFLGNVAAHEMTAPRAQELNAALDIAETLLKTIYVLPIIADSIRMGRQQKSSS